MNSYVLDNPAGPEAAYAEGDFVANFEGCQARPVPGQDDVVGAKGTTKKDAKKIVRTRDECEAEMGPMIRRWKDMVQGGH